jgi:hypothetical protein
MIDPDAAELIREIGQAVHRRPVGGYDDVAQGPVLESIPRKPARAAGEFGTVRRTTSPSTPSRVATASLAEGLEDAIGFSVDYGKRANAL